VIQGNVFPDNAEVNMWVTNDDNRVPLEIESPVSVGSVKAILKDYSGLRHEMKAKVN
jgi:methylaspartate ammonia-lyase